MCSILFQVGADAAKAFGVEELDEPKLILVDQSMGDKGSLIIDEDSDNIPLEYTSEAELEESGRVSEKEDVAMATTEEFPHDNDAKMEVSDTTSKMVDENSVKREAVKPDDRNDKQMDEETTEPVKPRRKGLPVRLKIPKSRLKTTIANLPKKRGRPAKSVEAKKRALPRRGRRQKNDGTEVYTCLEIFYVKE